MIRADPMLTMTTRRAVLGRATLLLGAAGGLLLASRLPAAAQAQGSQADIAFVRSVAGQITSILNAPGSLADKRAKILPLIDQNVDVNGIGRFCLGRYWRQATPEQQQQFLDLFHHVLLNSITDRLGEYKGVKVTVGTATPHGPDESAVSSIISRPGQPPTNVDWVIHDVNGQPKVADMIGEGVSLSITQRGDYSSYLQRNGNSIDRLLAAMRRQLSARAS